MTVTISPDDARDKVAKKLGASVQASSLRTSETRRRRLQKASQRRTREWSLALEIDDEHPTAHVEQRPDRGPKIVVTGREIEQSVTDLPQIDWDYAAQRGLGWHEDGHVLYTDHDDFRTRLNEIDTGDQGTAKQIWNTLEDAAIERQISKRWSNAYDVLRVLRSNICAESEPGITDVERGGRVFPVAHAVCSVLMDQWMDDVYDISTGVRDLLYDPDDDEYHFATPDDRDLFLHEIRPLCEAVVPDVLSEPVAEDRNRLIFLFIEDVLPLISQAQGDGKSQMNRDESKDSAGMPDDASEGHSGPAKADADQLGDIDPDDIEIVDGQPGEDAVPLEDVDLPSDVKDEIRDRVAGQRLDAAGVNDDLLDEMEEWQDALQGGGDIESNSVEIPDEAWPVKESTYRNALADSQKLARILRNRLQKERVSETHRGQRRGRFTGRGGALARARRGQKEVKERKVEPKEKDYHFMFVLDRSTSMRHRMSKAEEALGTLALALEEVGVETAIIELYSSTARLAKPFGKPVDQSKERIFSGKVAGGTPLGKALDLARGRLLREGSNSYVICVTDDEPTDSGRFERIVKKCTMPVLGVNIGTEESDADYDRQVGVMKDDNLGAVLTDLVQEVMF